MTISKTGAMHETVSMFLIILLAHPHRRKSTKTGENRGADPHGKGLLRRGENASPGITRT